MLGDYWDDAIVEKVGELFVNIKICSRTKIMDLKGIIGDRDDEDHFETRCEAS